MQKCSYKLSYKKGGAMLDPRYIVQGECWQNYPCASSIPTLFYAPAVFEASKSCEPDLLLERIALNVGKDTSVPSFLTSEEQLIMMKAFELEQKAMEQLEKDFKYYWVGQMREKRLWLLDSFGQKLLSGFIHTLRIDFRRYTGLVLKHDLNRENLTSAQNNLELKTLALIVAETFRLRKVVVASLWTRFDSFDIDAHSLKSLQMFKAELQLLLKKAL